MKDERRIKKLRHQSLKRGTKELDLILGNFALKYLDSLSLDELEQYEKFINLTDPEIYDILLEFKPKPDWLDKELLKIINKDYLIL